MWVFVTVAVAVVVWGGMGLAEVVVCGGGDEMRLICGFYGLMVIMSGCRQIEIRGRDVICND